MRFLIAVLSVYNLSSKPVAGRGINGAPQMRNLRNFAGASPIVPVRLSGVTYLIDHHCAKGILNLRSEVLVCLPAAGTKIKPARTDRVRVVLSQLNPYRGAVAFLEPNTWNQCRIVFVVIVVWVHALFVIYKNKNIQKRTEKF